MAPDPFPAACLNALRCSICAEQLEREPQSMRCRSGHTFNIAKQGYVNLLHARVPADTGDTTEMVQARTDFLAEGHYQPLADLIARRAANDSEPRVIVDAGAGTGYYLGTVLGRLPAASGIALDVSPRALRRAARAHPHVGAVAWNLWHQWPIRSNSTDVVLNVFAPRNTDEFARVIKPGGSLIVATPRRGHLGELAAVLDLLDIGTGKWNQLDTALAGEFRLETREQCVHTPVLAASDIRNVVGMGPNAYHLHRGNRSNQLEAIREPMRVTTAFTVSVYRRRAQ